jgi:predicted lipase
LLIQCSNIALEQFQVGSSNARYDGSIQSLKSYTPALNGFQQVAAFTVDETDTDVSGQIRPLRTLINQVRSPKPVYIGFALTSSQRNLIVLRGTQTPREWIANLQTSQVDYSQAGVQQGRIHRGFSRLYGKLSQQILQAAQRFSSAPTYVTGHSLGGALATLAAADLAANATRLKGQIQLYSYASPRVGDSAFARFYLSLVPNSYRVVNLADMVPEVPPSIIKGLEFQHVGQLWSFLAYTGNISPSHSTISYQIAINQQVETDRVPPFPS